MGYASLPEITEEISNVADAILDVDLPPNPHESGDTVRETPLRRTLEGESAECGFSVIALGKLGGRELNYSSDIDLMFVYCRQRPTDGASSITNKEFFKKIANLYTDLLSTYTADGPVYRVDLRLRPDGRLGEVCLSLEGAVLTTNPRRATGNCRC